MQRQTISIPFATGQKDKTGDAWVDAGALTTVTNGIFVKANALQKRPGIRNLGTTEIGAQGANNVSSAKRLAAYRNELLLFDGQYLRTYVEKLDAWRAQDETSPCVATRETVAQLSAGVYDTDVAELNGFRVFVWTDAVGTGGDTYFSVHDVANGAIVNSGYLRPAAGGIMATRPKLVAMSAASKIVAVGQRSTDNAIVARSMDVTVAPAWSTETVLVAGAATKAGVAFDAVLTTGSSVFLLAYEDNAGVIKLKQFNASLTNLVTGTSTDPNTGYDAITLRSDNGSGVCWLAYSYNTAQDVKVECFNPITLVETRAPFAVQAAAGPSWGNNIGIEQLDSTHAVVTFGFLGTGAAFQWVVVSSAGTITIPKKQGWHQLLLSRPFAVNSLDSVFGVRIYCLVAFRTPANQVTQFLVELNVRDDSSGTGTGAPHPVATVSPRFSSTSTFVPRSHGTLSNATNYGNPAATQFTIPGTVAESLGGVSATVAITFDWAHPGAYTTAELGSELYISGGVPCTYDGYRVVECGSLVTNDGITNLTNAAGGSLQSSVTYSYVFVPEWRDYKGTRHQGQPSLPVSVLTSVPNKKITATVPQINLTLMMDYLGGNPNIATPYTVPYRTVYSGGSMGTTYHRIINDAGFTPGYPGSFNVANESFAFTDDGTGTFSDATALTAELLYTTGGVLESDCPPSFTTLCAHKNRIFGVADDQRTIWFSTQYVPGTTVRFFDGFTLSCEEGGPIIAIASLENYLVVFKTDAIYYFTGEGPNQIGEQGEFTGPVRLPTDVGCTGPRGVLPTPQGLVFRTRDGLALLDRGLGIRSDLGDPVENLLGTNGIQLSSAMVHPSRPEYWFEVPITASAGEVFGRALVYNFRFDAWTLASRYDSVASRPGAFMCSAAAVNGTMYAVAPNGHVFSENALVPGIAAGQYKDGGVLAANWITMSAETPWLKPSLVEGSAKTNGYGRANKFLVLEEWKEPHDLSISVAYDYSAAFTDTFTFVSNYHTSGSQSLEELEIHLSRPKCEAVKLLWSDSPPTGADPANLGIGGAFTSISAEVAVYSGTNRTAGTRRK